MKVPVSALRQGLHSLKVFFELEGFTPKAVNMDRRLKSLVELKLHNFTQHPTGQRRLYPTASVASAAVPYPVTLEHVADLRVFPAVTLLI